MKIKELADNFDKWIINFKDSHVKEGTWENRTKAYVWFLTADSAARDISTYELYLELAKELQTRGHNISDPPCSEEEFNNALELYRYTNHSRDCNLFDTPHSKSFFAKKNSYKILSKEKRDSNTISYKSPYTNKEYLKEIQNNFSPKEIDSKFKERFSDKIGKFLYATDLEIKGYYGALCNLTKKNKSETDEKNNSKKLGIIIGNGCVISMLPDIPADDVLLLDIEPAVHCFLLYLRQLILNSNEEDFCSVKKELKCKIFDYSSDIYDTNQLVLEMRYLDNLHFLSSKERFAQCKEALKNKELLPIRVNIFDQKQMDLLSELIKKNNSTVAYLNLTNIADYDDKHILYESVCKLPLDKDSSMMLTCINGYDCTGISEFCYNAQDLKQLKEGIEKAYMRNTKPISSYRFSGW